MITALADASRAAAPPPATNGAANAATPATNGAAPKTGWVEIADPDADARAGDPPPEQPATPTALRLHDDAPACRPAPPPTARPTDGKVLTIIEHLQELRNRVIICCIALIVGVGVSI